MKVQTTITTIVFLLICIPFIDVYGATFMSEKTNRYSHFVSSGKKSNLEILNKLDDTPEYVKYQKQVMIGKGWTLKKSLT
jgi:hypothetical protein